MSVLMEVFLKTLGVKFLSKRCVLDRSLHLYMNSVHAEMLSYMIVHWY